MPDNYLEYINWCCGEDTEWCRCEKPITWDDVQHWTSLPLDEVYECTECMQECLCVGTPDCPSYRLYVIKSHAKERVGPITEMCEAFEPMHAHMPDDGYEADYSMPAKSREIAEQVEKTLEDMRAQYAAYEEYWGG